MSKLSAIGHFFHRLGQVAPAILAITPLAPIAGIVQAAIQEAEAIHGAGSGPAKLAHVVAIVTDAAQAANTQVGHEVINIQAVQNEAATVISAVVQATKLTPPKEAPPVKPADQQTS